MNTKKIENLTNDELEVLNEYMTIFGYETQEEALAAALQEGSITVDEGKASFIPEGFRKLKLFSAHQKAGETKLNKALRKAKKPELFEEDSFYLGTQLVKTDSGDFVLDECSTIPCGEKPEIVIIRTGYKAVRAAFDASGQPESTNFESTIADNIYPQGQTAMLTPYGNVKQVVSALKAEYPDGKSNKTQAKVPANLRVKFRVVIFGLVKTEEGNWEKFMYEASNRFNDDENILTEFEKRDKSVRIISKFKSKLTITGVDSFENPIVQIVEPEILADDEFKEIAKLIPDSTRAVAKFISEQVDRLKSSTDTNTNADANIPSNDEVDESDEVPKF